MCAACDERDNHEQRKYEAQPFVEAERARIREWAEDYLRAVSFQASSNMGHDRILNAQFQPINDLLEFLKEPE